MASEHYGVYLTGKMDVTVPSISVDTTNSFIIGSKRAESASDSVTKGAVLTVDLCVKDVDAKECKLPQDWCSFFGLQFYTMKEEICPIKLISIDDFRATVMNSDRIRIGYPQLIVEKIANGNRRCTIWISLKPKLRVLS